MMALSLSTGHVGAHRWSHSATEKGLSLPGSGAAWASIGASIRGEAPHARLFLLAGRKRQSAALSPQCPLPPGLNFSELQMQ